MQHLSHIHTLLKVTHTVKHKMNNGYSHSARGQVTKDYKSVGPYDSNGNGGGWVRTNPQAKYISPNYVGQVPNGQIPNFIVNQNTNQSYITKKR